MLPLAAIATTLAALATPFVGMAVLATLMAFLPEQTPLPILFPVAFLFGLTASGWNGVFVAEVTRLANSRSLVAQAPA